MSKELKKAAKARTGWFGWTIRIVGGTILACALAFAGFFAYFILAVYPKLVAEHTAEAQKAQAFAKLTGSARRLAIYDAFVAQIDLHYYDQTFWGFDWPRMKRDWRLKAASAANDTALYNDVFLQMTQRFPTSHVGTLPPLVGPHTAVKATASATPVSPSQQVPAYEAYQNVGFQYLPLRRRGGTVVIVGEVWHGSAAEKAGVTPGWIINRFTSSAASDHAHITATFTKLAPSQMHDLETTGAVQLITPEPGLSQAAVKAKLRTLQASVEYDAKYVAQDPDYLATRLSNGILYIRFNEFQAAPLQKVIAALKAADSRGVILDLRFNNGGYIMPLMNALLPGKTPIYIRRDAKGRHTNITADNTQAYNGPLVVLTGPESASAAEITAAVMKSTHRAIVVGRSTNGSVLEANFFPLPDGGQVEIPVADVEALNGKRLENVGVAPDMEVFPTIEEIRQGKDPALEMAEQRLLDSSHH